MRYFVFDTEQEALSGIESINTRSRILATGRGLTVDESGDIVSRKSDGTNNTEAQKTTTYAVPMQRLDGKWIVPHPEISSVGSLVINESGMTAAEFVILDIISATIETMPEDGSWFPKTTSKQRRI